MNNIKTKKRDYLMDLMRTKYTILTFKEVYLLWGKTDMDFVKQKLNRYVKTGKIYSVRKGIYAKGETYDKFELATKIYRPSYVSLETVLGRAGVTFQFYSQIFIASYISREITVDGQTYSFRKIKDSILTDLAGIEMEDNYYIASPERAFLDVVYLNKDYHFDNLSSLNWDKVYEILPIYGGNKRMEKKIKQYHEAVQKNLN